MRMEWIYLIWAREKRIKFMEWVGGYHFIFIYFNSFNKFNKILIFSLFFFSLFNFMRWNEREEEKKKNNRIITFLFVSHFIPFQFANSLHLIYRSNFSKSRKMSWNVLSIFFNLTTSSNHKNKFKNSFYVIRKLFN